MASLDHAHEPDLRSPCDRCYRLAAAERDARRCRSVYPGLDTLIGRAIRCERAVGHDGQHGHSFAARYWD